VFRVQASGLGSTQFNEDNLVTRAYSSGCRIRNLGSRDWVLGI
jgi:hypothetical protein